MNVETRDERSARLRRQDLEEVRRRVAEKQAAARRTRLHYFGLAGGRR